MLIEYHSEVLLDMIRYYLFIPILENSSKIGKILFYLKSSFVFFSALRCVTFWIYALYTSTQKLQATSATNNVLFDTKILHCFT